MKKTFRLSVSLIATALVLSTFSFTACNNSSDANKEKPKDSVSPAKMEPTAPATRDTPKTTVDSGNKTKPTPMGN